MKAFKILMCTLLLASVSVYAADKKPTNVPLVQKNQQAQPKSNSNSDYTWQDCVNDNIGEGGHTKEEAYKLCEGRQ